MNRPQIVIVGAGFVGKNLAKALKTGPVATTILNRRKVHLSQPLLYI